MHDKDGPFAFDGRLTLIAATATSAGGNARAARHTPPAMERSLELLGPADAAGRRQFSVERLALIAAAAVHSRHAESSGKYSPSRIGSGPSSRISSA